MRIAIPVSGGLLAQHFGHCEQFELIDVDVAAKSVVHSAVLPAPPHAHGVLPRWLHENGANLVIAGGMGAGARSLFQAAGIDVLTGVESRSTNAVVEDYLKGTLVTGVTSCNHGAGHEHGCH
ncbi:NifB/NifX family molybdenum-iron cluster-binding protein [uncultured Paludibaculum sp.]|uniref:NifB/NifX family molybdenum-iron cluster-binding protein n=1 Tax=uncultured Paludibaculum sp. TaxID=1765020 RepID=UPI002AAC42EF|nr:NifB/NifX family molybdenum-iron cluster-binding protein [uncultured Paludibaculum sp.]